MITVSFNAGNHHASSVKLFAAAIEEYARSPLFEPCLSVPNGPTIFMLRNAEHAFLMYLRHYGDSGFTSAGGGPSDAHVAYALSNGQVDEYPQSWCLPVGQCFKALTHFFVNNGQGPEGIAWHES